MIKILIMYIKLLKKIKRKKRVPPLRLEKPSKTFTHYIVVARSAFCDVAIVARMSAFLIRDEFELKTK